MSILGKRICLPWHLSADDGRIILGRKAALFVDITPFLDIDVLQQWSACSAGYRHRVMMTDLRPMQPLFRATILKRYLLLTLPVPMLSRINPRCDEETCRKPTTPWLRWGEVAGYPWCQSIDGSESITVYRQNWPRYRWVVCSQVCGALMKRRLGACCYSFNSLILCDTYHAPRGEAIAGIWRRAVRDRA